ncbi:MAG: metallophosphoesterase family protein [Solirubrobacterales bacterium]|nr:metallophosphoesterase family protein [Solirubrobacterales bacterium]MBV9165128.1 metallophosphoesterase family protein [Solirubrobacterales bacterium]MBV9536493.1 metallophosphoesterase family protein [Solirubrobacterales bacterium]
MATRLYIASDFHAAEKAWRKFLNAISMNVYKADVALLAGDLTGKAIVPIIRRNGRYEAELFGVHRSARGEQELAALERDIADVGYYSFITTGEEAERLASDEAARDDLLHRLMNERVEAWLGLATERLGEGSTPLYLIPGNDDEFVIDPILDEPGHAPINAEGKVLDIPGDLQLLASGWSNYTPWQTPREESEDELYARLDRLAQQVREPRRAVFMIHVPPHDSGLDTAPILNENLRPTVSAGDVLRGPVGSTAVRRIVEDYQPLLTIHGHIHESGGERKIGKTLCINPGSEANHGILRGYLVDISKKGIDLVQRVEG